MVVHKIYQMLKGVKDSGEVFYTYDEGKVVACRYKMSDNGVLLIIGANGEFYNIFNTMFYGCIEDCVNRENMLSVYSKWDYEILEEMGYEVNNSKYIKLYKVDGNAVKEEVVSINYLKIGYNYEDGFKVEIDKTYLRNYYFDKEEAKSKCKIELILF